MQRDLQLHYPSGVYTCFYEGDGNITFGFDAKVISMRKGMIKTQVTPSTVQDNGIYLQITATNPSNPIRNIRVIMPGFKHTAERMPFHPLFLDSIRKYKTLRFMDWALTNNAQDVEFSNRIRPNFVSQAWRGKTHLPILMQLESLHMLIVEI
jgi:hypothetical protein